MPILATKLYIPPLRNGDRIGQTTTVGSTVTSTTTYVLDTATPLTMVLSETTNGVTTTYWHGLDVLAQKTGTVVSAFQYDGLGSVRQLTDDTGAPTLAQTFDPYGNSFSKAGSVNTVLGYTGEQQDASGFVFLRARYYNPANGRFFQTDPSRREMNPYQYAVGNPINFVDPSGNEASPVDFCRSLFQPLKGQCIATLLLIAAGIAESDNTQLAGIVGIGSSSEYYNAFASKWPHAAEFMASYLGYYPSKLIPTLHFSSFRLGEARYMNLYRFLQESPNLVQDLETNFMKCVAHPNPTDPCAVGDGGVEPNGKGLDSIPPSQGTLNVKYENPYWRFRLAADDTLNPDLARTIKTFTVGAHTEFATVRDIGDFRTYYAEVEAWDNYDWKSNDSLSAEGNHPFGMLSSDFLAAEEAGYAKPYTVFGGIDYRLTVYLPACATAEGLVISSGYLPSLDATFSLPYLSSTSLRESGYVPMHNKSNTDNVDFY